MPREGPLPGRGRGKAYGSTHVSQVGLFVDAALCLYTCLYSVQLAICHTKLANYRPTRACMQTVSRPRTRVSASVSAPVSLSVLAAAVFVCTGNKPDQPSPSFLAVCLVARNKTTVVAPRHFRGNPGGAWVGGAARLAQNCQRGGNPGCAVVKRWSQALVLAPYLPLSRAVEGR